jgi:hypothetical protein
MKGGVIVTFVTRETGKVQKAILRNADQTALLKAQGRAFLRLVDDDLEPLKDAVGKRLISIKPLNILKTIGFID